MQREAIVFAVANDVADDLEHVVLKKEFPKQ